MPLRMSSIPLLLSLSSGCQWRLAEVLPDLSSAGLCSCRAPVYNLAVRRQCFVPWAGYIRMGAGCVHDRIKALFITLSARALFDLCSVHAGDDLIELVT